MLRNIVLVLALLALVSGIAVYSDNGVRSNRLIKATSTEPQALGDIISSPTNEASVPSCHSDTDKSIAPGCCGNTDRPTITSCCGST